MKNINKYIEAVSENRLERFNELISRIQTWYPEAELTMKYNMPTFEIEENWLAAANQKNYISVYTCGYFHIESYKEKHPDTKSGKGCLNFRDKDKIYYCDLERVARSTLTAGTQKG